jgi:hypothetical protein
MRSAVPAPGESRGPSGSRAIEDRLTRWPDVLQGTDNPRITPRGIVLGHPHDQAPDLREGAWTPTAPLRACPFVRDQSPMPAQNRVGRHDRGNVVKAATTQPMSEPRQPMAFFVGQADPAAPRPRIMRFSSIR